jgi:hypothetical protein
MRAILEYVTRKRSEISTKKHTTKMAGVVTAVALYDNNPGDPRELGFRAGNLLQIVKEDGGVTGPWLSLFFI